MPAVSDKQEPRVTLADGGFLLCPSCGNGFLHHGQVDCYERRQEDAPRGRRVTVGSPVMVDEDAPMARCPSARRSGITVQFWCETCPDDAISYELCLVQRKGETMLFWRPTGGDDASGE